MRRVLAAAFAAALVSAVVAAAATAAGPTRSTESVVGDQVVCGDTVLTATQGKIVQWESFRKLGSSGYWRAHFHGVTRHIRLTDEDGNGYRAVGSFSGTFILSDPNDENSAVRGFFRQKINFIRRGGGLLGTAETTERLHRDGTSTTRNRGNCVLPDE